MSATYVFGPTLYEVWGQGEWEYIDMPKTLNPADRSYMREVFGSGSGIRFMELLISLRPRLGGTSDQSAAAASYKAEGYELAISHIGLLLEEPANPPEARSIDIRAD